MFATQLCVLASVGACTRKWSSGRLNETAMQRPLLTDLKCKFMKEGTNLVLDLVGLVEWDSR